MCVRAVCQTTAGMHRIPASLGVTTGRAGEYPASPQPSRGRAHDERAKSTEGVDEQNSKKKPAVARATAEARLKRGVVGSSLMRN